MDRYVFPAEFRRTESGNYVVTFPDLPGCVTEGGTVEEALAMARECLELHLYGMEEDGEEIPFPTPPERLEVRPPAFLTLVEAWMPPVRDEMASLAVKKTLTIPKWLNDLAEERRVNYSRILQEALKEHLAVRDRPRRSTLRDR
ncbi:MAG: type II toxin-antitoxin system HicB family antitoxin [Bacillota bacterium]|jgi:predicted RNase H-like HicB family nuclease